MIGEATKKEIAVDLIRIGCFLENNQLVQANALAQKVSSMIEDVIKRPDGAISVPDTDPYFNLYRVMSRVRTYVLGGKAKEALAEIKGVK